MLKSRLTFVLVTLMLLLLASCTITKRRYLDGYHVEWAKRHTMPRVEAIPEESPTLHANMFDSLGNCAALVNAPDTMRSDEILPREISKGEGIHSKKIKTPFRINSHVLKRENLKALTYSAIQVFDTHEKQSDGGLTGIRWLNIVIGILVLFGVILLVIYANPKLQAEINAVWAAFTANIWISILYILLFLLCLALLWAALDAMFGGMFSSY